MKKQNFLMEIVMLVVVMGLAGCSNPETGISGRDGSLSDDSLGTSLVVSAGNLEPEFDKDIFDYILVVDNKYESVVFSFSQSGVDKNIEVSGADSLDEGKNDVTVTLSEGTVYNITVIRLPSGNLSKITISASDFQNAPVILTNPGDFVNEILPYHASPPPVTVTFEANPPVAQNAVFTMTGAIGGIDMSGDQIAGVDIDAGVVQTGTVQTSVSFEVDGKTYSADKTYKITLSRPGAESLAIGGGVEKTTVDGIEYEVHSFTTSGTLVIPPNVIGKIAEVLVVGGGGGGGGGSEGDVNRRGGGGGAGRFVYEAAYPLNETAITIVIGEGGEGSTGKNVASKGGDSSFGTLTAVGGGAGTSHNIVNVNRNGGSGGGATNGSLANVAGKASTGAGSGNDGGVCTANYNYSAAGGGGAGAKGADISGQKSGTAGGDGLPSDISGKEVWYAGGGGAGGDLAGGKGGGGKGAPSSGENSGLNGEAGTGGGGGGGYDKKVGSTWYSAGGNGGSGMVIMRFPLN